LPTLIFLVIIIYNKSFVLQPRLKFINKELRDTIFSVALFGIISGYGNILVQRIDVIMINSMIDIESAGVYTIAMFFGVLVSIPYRSILRISSSVVAEAFKRNDIATIQSVYKKSGQTQLIIGSLLFIGIWANLDNVHHILPSEYHKGDYVIFFIGLANLVKMLFGQAHGIIGLSKHYRYQTYFTLVLGILTLITNLIFIPIWGITGAGIASLISILTHNIIMYLFLKIKFGLEPFGKVTIIIILIAVISYATGYIIPALPNFIFDIFIRSLIITAVFGILIIYLKVSEDVNIFVNQIISRFNNILKK
jgi:O-antigen/teichoic acid export membrane protein